VKPAALAMALAVSFRWCGGDSPDVKSYIVAVDAHGKSWLVNTAVYRADADKQTVIKWIEGGIMGPSRLDNCAVRDRLNWRCEYEDGSGGAQMVDGRFSDFGGRTPDPNKHLTETEWEALKATGNVTVSPAMTWPQAKP
jgi:hypothetical protein